MKLDPRNIINSPFGINIAYLLGRFMPYPLGHRIALFVADRLAARKDWKLVRAVRSNQWVVNGENPDKTALDKAVAENFRHIASSIFDLYHNLNNPAQSLRIIDPHPLAVQLVQRPEFADRGMILAGIHMSNFDLVFQTGGLAGIKALALTLPELSKGYNKQWEMRVGKGIDFTPISVGALKRTVEYLKAGGMVITAVDRPDPGNLYRPRFFGHPAAVPIHYIFLAVKARVPIRIIAPYKHPDGKYHFLFSELIEMQPYQDRHEEIMVNAENVLHIAEEFIRHDPSQWAMTFPVWPDIMDQVP
jgi:KDO2-lipid IV(A) lauroyltransferase